MSERPTGGRRQYGLGASDSAATRSLASWTSSGARVKEAREDAVKAAEGSLRAVGAERAAGDTGRLSLLLCCRLPLVSWNDKAFPQTT